MAKVSTDKKKIQELLSRGVAEVVELKSLEQKLKSGKQLTVKLGIDATGPNLHLGRSIPLLKLRAFQELGHQAVFIIGDATAEVGDTSDKDSERPMLKPEQVKINMKTYLKQAGLVVDLNKTKVLYNSVWLKKLGFKEIGEQADSFSLAEFMARDNIKRRHQKGQRISLRELLYPLMQGYDSVQVKADVELGGTDQRFNLLAGRTLQQHYGQRPQDIMTNNLIEGTDGRKMSSSWGNTINLTDSAKDMFGRVMSLPDQLILPYFIHCTISGMNEIKQIEGALQRGLNPKEAKEKLAKAIVSFYYDSKVAAREAENFKAQFSSKSLPQDMLEKKFRAKNLVDLLVEIKLASSKSEARRLIQQKGVKINQKTSDEASSFTVGDVIQVGKRKFVRLK